MHIIGTRKHNEAKNTQFIDQVNALLQWNPITGVSSPGLIGKSITMAQTDKAISCCLKLNGKSITMANR